MRVIPFKWLVNRLKRLRMTEPEARNYINKYYEQYTPMIKTDLFLLNAWESETIYLEPQLLRNYITKREEFNSIYRDKYLVFKSNNFISGYEQDELFEYYKASVVHHIFPLTFGGLNELNNLIYINDFHHELLHLNPRECEQKFCYLSVDYLWYLNNFWLRDRWDYFCKTYDKNFLDKAAAAAEYYQYIIKNEMMKFYKGIKNY